jgi:DNA-binding Xre family transcriptional regulator
MISTQIKQLMADLQLQQKDLAEVLEVPIDRVKNLTAGRVKNLTRDETELLVQKLNIRPQWLISGTGTMLSDDESDDEFVARQQGISRMNMLINAMPLGAFTRLRLCALMTGDVALDAVQVQKAIHDEALGIDFVTGKPLGSAKLGVGQSPRVAALLDNYAHASEEGKKVIEGTASLAAKSKAA